MNQTHNITFELALGLLIALTSGRPSRLSRKSKLTEFSSAVLEEESRADLRPVFLISDGDDEEVFPGEVFGE